MNFEEFRSCIKSEYKFANVQVAETGTIGECKISVKNCSAQDKAIIREILTPVFKKTGLKWTKDDDKIRFTDKQLSKVKLDDLRDIFERVLKKHGKIVVPEFKEQDIIKPLYTYTDKELSGMTEDEVIWAAYKSTRHLHGLNIVPVFGFTGVGKSTLINYLKGQRVERRRSEGCALSKDQKEYSKVGYDNHVSETFAPIGIKDKDDNGDEFVYVDMPGFEDTRSRCDFMNKEKAKNIRKYLFYTYRFSIEASSNIKSIMYIFKRGYIEALTTRGDFSLTDSLYSHLYYTPFLNSDLFDSESSMISVISKLGSCYELRSRDKILQQLKGILDDLIKEHEAGKEAPGRPEAIKAVRHIYNSTILLSDITGEMYDEKKSLSDASDAIAIKKAISNSRPVDKSIFLAPPIISCKHSYSTKTNLSEILNKQREIEQQEIKATCKVIRIGNTLAAIGLIATAGSVAVFILVPGASVLFLGLASLSAATAVISAISSGMHYYKNSKLIDMRDEIKVIEDRTVSDDKNDMDKSKAMPGA